MADAKIISMQQIRNCPKRSLAPRHWYDDGTCKCAERQEVMRELEDAQTFFAKAKADVDYWKQRLEDC